MGDICRRWEDEPARHGLWVMESLADKDWRWGGEADQWGLSCKHTVVSWDNGGACDEGHLQSVGRVKGNEKADHGTQGW